MENEISFGALESENDPRTIMSSDIAMGGLMASEGKTPLDYDTVNDLCDQRKNGICTMCGVRMAAENHFHDGVRLDEYWGYLMGKTLIDDPKFGSHFEGSSALTMLKVATNYGIPEKKFCETYKLKTNGTYSEFIGWFNTKYGGKIPNGILENAAKHKIPGYFRIATDQSKGSPSALEIINEINKGKVIVSRFALGKNLHTDKKGKYTRKAKDLLPVRAPEKKESGHIMTINEYWKEGEELGGPNSWSRMWCPDNTKQEAGYYWFKYTTQIGFFTEAWAIMDKEDKYVFNNDLTLGSTGPDVVALQKHLVKIGFMVMPQGVSHGYFGKITEEGVAKYQKKYKITPSVGYFGPKTREHLNKNQ